MASTHTDKLAVRQSIEVQDDRPGEVSKLPHLQVIEMPSEMASDSGVDMEHADNLDAGEPPTHENCDGDHNSDFDPRITISTTSKMAGQTVAPFLAKHIPDQYAPLPPATASQKDPNTKYCYRHRPDAKCRRTADEPTMENLQNVRSPVRYDRQD